MLRFFEVSLLINALLSYAVGLVVLKRGFKSKQILLWSFVCFSIGTWSLGISRIVVADSYEEAWTWNSVLYSGAIFIPIFYYHFIAELIGFRSSVRKLTIFAGYAFAVFFLIVNFTPYFVEDIPPVFIFKHWVKPGLFYFPFFVYFVTYLALSLILIFAGRREATGRTRQQLNYVLLAGVFGISGGLTVFFPQFIGLYPFGSYFVVLYLVIMAYAILKYRLMGIRVLVSKFYMVGLIAIIFYALHYTWMFMEQAFFGDSYNPFSLLASVLIAFASAALLFFFLGYIQRSSDIIFFRGHNPRTIIKDLSIRIGGVIDLEQLVKIIVGEFRKILGTDEIKFVFLDQNEQSKKSKNKRSIEISVIHKEVSRKTEIGTSNSIYQTISKFKKTIVRDELEARKDKELIKELDDKKAKIVAPLISHKRVTGVILLGEKISQGAYTREDIEFLEIISAQAATAFENARLYKETRDFNERLEKEVKRATDEVQRTNIELTKSNSKLTSAYEKLTKLDRAKSEFLSIASHQLRTPLTSIKGFTSLLLEGTYGKISKSVRTTLEKVYISNERLISLVEDLLNISRIESGRLTFDFKDSSIEELAEEIVDSMNIAAKNKKLKFKYNKPKKKIKPFVFDDGKMKEVVSNLVDNSIKYTPKGEVSLTVEETSKVVRVIVEDSGIGIRKGELDYIFERFQRGKDINQVHTEGVGLGLYVCKKVVEAHKGEVWAESDGLGKGSKFIVELKKNFKGDSKVEKKK